MNITSVGSSTASYMIVLDDDNNSDEDNTTEITVQEVNTSKEPVTNEMSPELAMSIIGIFILIILLLLSSAYFSTDY